MLAIFFTKYFVSVRIFVPLGLGARDGSVPTILVASSSVMVGTLMLAPYFSSFILFGVSRGAASLWRVSLLLLVVPFVGQPSVTAFRPRRTESRSLVSYSNHC